VRERRINIDARHDIAPIRRSTKPLSPTGEGATPSHFWHFGHQNVERCPSTACRTGVPQTRHGSPSRP
jgi:hypothetical protein